MPRVRLKPKDIHKFPSHLAKIFKGKKGKKSVAGIALVSKRLKKLGKIAPNGQPIEFVRALLIKKGDVVPKVFRGIAGLKVGANGIAQESYPDSWCQSHWNESGNWNDSWGECWDNSTGMPSLRGKSMLVVNSLTTNVKAFSFNEFSQTEMKALSKYGI